MKACAKLILKIKQRDQEKQLLILQQEYRNIKTMKKLTMYKKVFIFL